VTAAALRRAVAGTSALIDSRPLLCAVLAALSVAALTLRLGGMINHDTAWYLYATGRLLDGARLYVDIVELNPPLAFYLTVPPVMVARLLGLASVDVFVVYVFALAAGSLALTRRVLCSLPPEEARLRRWLLVAALFAVVALPGPAFGQREHFMVILGLPYLALIAMRANGRAVPLGLALAAGIAGCLGFALKPPFLAVPAVLELYLFAVRRPRLPLLRSETLALGVSVAVYALSIPLLTPEYVDFIVPMTAAVYGAFEAPLLVVLARIETLLVPFAIAAVLVMRDRSAGSRAVEVFLIAGVSDYALYLVQMKGWQYQAYPVSAMLMLIAGASLARPHPNQDRSRAGALRILRPSLLAVLLLATLMTDLTIRGNYRNGLATALLPLVRANAAEGGVAVLSANVSWGFPLAYYAGADWPLRFPALWPLPGLVRARAADRGPAPALDRLERYVTDAVVEDFTRRPPAVVLVDIRARKNYFGDLPFDYLEFFGRDPRFRRLWQDYAFAKAGPSVAVYVRRPGQGAGNAAR
jgi:hypothetical protein